MSAEAIEAGRVWQEVTGLAVIDWTDETLPAAAVADDSLVPPDDIARHRANVARYALLSAHGGMWIDCDVRLLKMFPLRMLAEPFVASSRGGAEPFVMGGPAGHPFFDALLAGVAGPGATAVDVSGARMLRRVIEGFPAVRVCEPSMWGAHDRSALVIRHQIYAKHGWATTRTRAKAGRS